MEWILTGGNFVPAESLAALARMDEERAFTIIEREPLDRVESLAAFWMPPLLLADPLRLRAAIRNRFGDGTLSPAWLHWELRGEKEPDPPMIVALIERTAQLVAKELTAVKSERPPVEIEHLLATLGVINSVEGTQILRCCWYA